jgi:oligosaccharide repeat unit polymerase
MGKFTTMSILPLGAFVFRPDRLMASVWIGWSLTYALNPVVFDPGIPPATWLFIALSVSAFCFGSALQRTRVFSRKKAESLRVGWLELFPRVGSKSRVLPSGLDSRAGTAKLLVFIGVVGSLGVGYSRYYLSGVDYSKGIAVSRLSIGVPKETPLLTYLAFPLYSLGVVGSLFLLNAATKPVPNFYRRLCWVGAGLLSSTLVPIVYGGRGGLLLLLSMIFFAYRQTRALRSEIVSRRLVRLLGFCFVLVFLAYSWRLFSDRQASVGRSADDASLKHWRSNYGIRPEGWLENLRENGTIGPSFLINYTSTSFYLLGGPPNLAKTLDLGPLPSTFGAAQIGLFPPVAQRVFPFLNASKLVEDANNKVGTAGLLPTAFGMFVIDFGWFGALLECVLWGYFAQMVARRAISKSNMRPLNSLLLTSILMSPISAPLGFSESSFLLFGCVMAIRFLKPKHRVRPLTKSEFQR